MPAAKKLTPKQIENALAQLPGWTLRKGKLAREFPSRTSARRSRS
jgi:pterin-4a-carbinolamine dehydratase